MDHAFNILDTTLGASFINDMANSDGIKTLYPATTQLSHAVPGGDVRFDMSYHSYGLFTEYVSALASFALKDMSFNDHKAVPQSLHIELNHSFKLFNQLNTAAVGLTETFEALALNVPKQRVYIQDSLTLDKNLNVALELDVDSHYASADTAVYTGGNKVMQDGETHLAGSVQLGYYF